MPDPRTWSMTQLERMMAGSPDTAKAIMQAIANKNTIEQQIAQNQAASAPPPSPVQIAPVIDLVSNFMTPKQSTANSPTGGDGANKQAYGGDIATLRPVANAGDAGGTMLTGPVGVDPDALLLAKKTLLGA